MSVSHLPLLSILAEQIFEARVDQVHGQLRQVPPALLAQDIGDVARHVLTKDRRHRLRSVERPALVHDLPLHRPGLQRRPAQRRKRAAGTVGAGPHPVGLRFQRRILVQRHVAEPRGRLHPPLPLLHRMPGLVRQMPFLAAAEMDVPPLRESEGAEPGGLG